MTAEWVPFFSSAFVSFLTVTTTKRIGSALQTGGQDANELIPKSAKKEKKKWVAPPPPKVLQKDEEKKKRLTIVLEWLIT